MRFLDYAVIGLYAFAMLAIGRYYAMRTKTTDDYLLGGRRMSLDDFGLRTSIYNHQLCTIDRRIWPLAVKSISDWKNEYRPECSGCSVMERCGGFFATGRLRQSRHISAVICDVASPAP